MQWRGRSSRHFLLLILAGTAICAAPPAPAFAAVSLGIAPTVVINEVSTTNFAGAADEKGKRGDWVELYNSTSATVDLTGWGLSASTKNPFRWVFPSGTKLSARAYLRVWTDKADRVTSTSNLHTNFNLDNGVDAVVLTAPNLTASGVLVDSTTPPVTGTDVSWCRMPSGDPAAPFTTCLTPTPKAANSGATAGGLLATPTLSVASGVYGATQSVQVTGPAQAQLRYTLDGSLPTTTSTAVTGPVAITTSSVLRVAAFQTGMVTSNAATASYVIDGSGRFAGQRLVFLTMKPSDRSLFAAGGSAPSYGWRSGMELIGPAGDHAFAGEAATEQAGQAGSRNGQKTMPMDIKFTDALGTKNVTYPIFSAKPKVTKFKKLRLRNSGDDYQEAHLRDQFFQALGTEAQLAPSASEPAQVFLNGTYYGMMDLREKEDETLIESTYGVDKDDVEYLSDSKVLNGDTATTEFNALYTYLTGNDMSVPANYAKATQLLDMENFGQDFALHLFAADRDWQWRNMQYFRMPSYDGRWRYRVHDFDISGDGVNAWGYDTRETVDMNDMYGRGDRSATMMRALLKNPTFKALYAGIVADQLNTVLLPQNSSAVLDGFADPMAPYLPNHITLVGQPTSMAVWQSQVTRLRTFLQQRPAPYETHQRSYLTLTARNAVTVGVNDPAMGTVKVNTIDLTSRLTAAQPTWTGAYFGNVPLTLEARPKPGYVFTGWQGDDTGTDRVITPTVSVAGRTYSATFAPAATVPAPTVAAVADRTTTTGTLISLPIAASDPNGYPLTYSAKQLPSGLDINPATGRIYGKPTKAGVYASTISVGNGKATTKIAVAWTVTNTLDRTYPLPLKVVGDGTGLMGNYYASNAFLLSPVLTRTEAPAIHLGSGAGPAAGLGTSGWAIRWTGTVTAPVDGVYTIRATVQSDDGVRMSVDGQPLFDAWTSGATNPTAAVTLTAGRPTPVTIEFWDKAGAASLTMTWLLPGQSSYVPFDNAALNPA